MNHRFPRGLVVGKFCPLHHGHEFLIRTALAACDEVLVISYTKPEFDGAGVILRQQWLQSIFPQIRLLVIDDEALRRLCKILHIAEVPEIPHNDASADSHRRFVGWLCWTVLKTPVDAVFTSEDYGDGFAAVLSDYFSCRLQQPWQVEHVCVDRQRLTVPISGTAVRADPHGLSARLSPVVYASYVGRICLLGGESSGKTTLAQALASHFDTGWVAEYGRELWERQNGVLRYDDMLEIGQVQLRREQAAGMTARRWLFCDTSPLTTWFYCHDMFGRTEPELERLSHQRYDLVLVCAPDFAFIQDGTRRDETFRARQHDWYQAELTRRGIDYVVLSGPLRQRVASVAALLQAST